MQSQQWIVRSIILCASLVQIFMPVEAFPIAHKIKSLPGQPQVSFQQFAGYITIDEKQKRALFYYFVEAEAQPASKPLVLWLHGVVAEDSVKDGVADFRSFQSCFNISFGPGCSSVGAAFLEHGPFKVSGDSLVRNDYNWNKEANMLYLESPAGVGYSANKSFYTYVNDEITARDNLLFLQLWFAKFPEYRSRDFFIAGVSYGGHYVPQLAQLIIQSNVKINLKGIAVGNPLLDFTTDLNSRDEYYWSHGLISDVVYQLLTKVCNSSERFRNTLINGGRSLSCNNVSSQLNKELIDSIDTNNVIGDVCQTQLQTKEIICGQVITENYLNRKDVQKALHAQLLGLDQRSLCIDPSVLRYDLKNLEIPTIGVVGSLVKSGIRVLVYSGDQDAVIPFTSSRRLVDRLAKELGLKTTVPYRAWFEGKQVGGWTQIYGKPSYLLPA